MNENIKVTLSLFFIILVLMLLSASGLFILYPILATQIISYTIVTIPLLTLLVIFIQLFTPKKAK